MPFSALSTTKVFKNGCTLPPDTTFKGYQSVVVQDIIIMADNIKFRKEVYYSL
jgi:hypothetical protein